MRRAPVSIATLGAAAALAAGLSACGVVKRDPNLIAGKGAFIAKCGSCHTLNRAGSKGVQGPDLDEAFREALSEGIKRSTIKGVVHRQIEIPNSKTQLDPQTLKPLVAMPANLVKGDTAEDVASYVSSVVSKPGKDAGRLAEVGASKSKGNAVAKNGELDIPAVPTGQTAYEFATASAPAGKIAIKSVNKSSTGHNIAIEGNGVKQAGKVVKGGATSEVDVTLKPGTYTFFCTVPGHREGGMEGKLTVK